MEKTPGPNVLAQSIRTSPGEGISPNQKSQLADAFENLTNTRGYSHELAKKLKVVELSYRPNVEMPDKMEARTVCEVIVDDDMVNDAKILHGGCSAFLVDFCGSIVITLYELCSSKDSWGKHVSKTINMIYHSPAPGGYKLKIVNSTVAMGTRSMTARTEIYAYDATKPQIRPRLVASGEHVKMDFAVAKL